MPVNDDLSYELSKFAERPRFDDSVSQLIRSAERFMSLQRYAFAEDQLNLAKTLEPNNAYIWAIQERLHTMNIQQQGAFTGTGIVDKNSDASSQRYLSVTVGPEFETGFKGMESENNLNQNELQTRIRQLTSVAENFVDKGLPENAFDSLMKAYLLDPVSPYVISCEKMVLPAWEATHNNAGSLTAKYFGKTEATEGGTAMSQIQDTILSAEAQKRMDNLKLQKEFERKEREREMWRQASSPPTMKGSEPLLPANIPQIQNPDAPKTSGGLFNKLKLGKFLG